VVRVEGTMLSEAERLALDGWACRSPRHRASLARAKASWTALAHLRPAVVPVVACRARPRRRFLMQTAVLLLAAGAAGWMRAGAAPADHRTARGEVRGVLLPDGSRLVLAGGSAAAVRYDAGVRRVDLLEGEALFAPAPVGAGEARPFVVFAGAGRVRAVGTRFTVARRARGFDVAVLEHSIEVSLDGRDALGAVVVQQAQALRCDGTGLGQPHRIDPARQAAWTEGRLVFDRMALADVADVLNRYGGGRIVIASSGLAARRVSGVFESDRTAEALRTIVAELGARSLALPIGVTILF